MDGLLAGIAEKLADDQGVPRPAWTADVPRLRQPWTPRGGREGRTLEAEPVLAERGILVKRGGLLLRSATVGL